MICAGCSLTAATRGSGVAVQLCSLRWLGFVPDVLAELPRPALLALSEQLETDPDDLMLYGARAQTRTDHFGAVRERAGFRLFDQARRDELEEWLGGERSSTSARRRCGSCAASTCSPSGSSARPSTRSYA